MTRGEGGSENLQICVSSLMDDPYADSANHTVQSLKLVLSSLVFSIFDFDIKNAKGNLQKNPELMPEKVHLHLLINKSELQSDMNIKYVLI